MSKSLPQTLRCKHYLGLAAALMLALGLCAPAPLRAQEAGPTADWWEFGVRPALRGGRASNGEDFVLDLGVRARARAILAPGLTVQGAVAQSIVGDYARLERAPGGTLPRVRTDRDVYARESLDGLRIVHLFADQYAPLGAGFHLRATGGVLEDMYAGVSAEVLWWPAGGPIALGAEVNRVRARAFRQDFNTRDLPGLAQTHGHASVYWQTPLQGLRVQLDAGRYLAGDRGATLTVARDLPGGWTLGAFASSTSASAAEFGPGGQDKGVFVRVPLGRLIGRGGTEVRQIALRPERGDGGQRLNLETRLYDRLRTEGASLR